MGVTVDAKASYFRYFLTLWKTILQSIALVFHKTALFWYSFVTYYI